MSRRPTIRQLECFVAAVEHGTFSAAAAAEHVSQPSLSEQIAGLERLLGARLFTRTSRGLLLSDSGRALLPHARATLQSADELSERLRGAQALEEGLVSFGTFNSAHLYFLTDLIREFHERYPSVRIRLHGLNSSEVADMVRAGELEAGLVQLPVQATNLDVSNPVFTDHVVYVSADPERVAHPVRIHELSKRPLILSEARWSQDDPLRRTLSERAQRAGVTVAPLLEVEFQTHALELARQGIGDTLVSYHVARDMLRDNELYACELAPTVIEHYAFVVRRSGATSPATTEFMRMTRAVVERLA